jgi:hypothetical protein
VCAYIAVVNIISNLHDGNAQSDGKLKASHPSFAFAPQLTSLLGTRVFI